MKKKPKAVILQSRAKQLSPAAPLAPDLSVDDSQNWKFDDVDESELVACCYWEYARESASIRGAVEIAKTAFANERIPKPASEEREVFRAAANKAFGLLIQTGFDKSFSVSACRFQRRGDQWTKPSEKSGGTAALNIRRR